LRGTPASCTIPARSLFWPAFYLPVLPEREKEIALQYLIDDGFVCMRAGLFCFRLISPHRGHAMVHAR
jgi:hypothetical protein